MAIVEQDRKTHTSSQPKKGFLARIFSMLGSSSPASSPDVLDDSEKKLGKKFTISTGYEEEGEIDKIGRDAVISFRNLEPSEQDKARFAIGKTKPNSLEKISENSVYFVEQMSEKVSSLVVQAKALMSPEGKKVKWSFASTNDGEIIARIPISERIITTEWKDGKKVDVTIDAPDGKKLNEFKQVLDSLSNEGFLENVDDKKEHPYIEKKSKQFDVETLRISGDNLNKLIENGIIDCPSAFRMRDLLKKEQSTEQYISM